MIFKTSLVLQFVNLKISTYSIEFALTDLMELVTNSKKIIL